MRRPRRLRLSRAKGWRKPEGAIVVSRPSKWGNPWKLGDTITIEGRGTYVITPELAVDMYKQDHVWDADEIRAALAGRDLLCWCRDGEPCHADWLLEVANPTPKVVITINYPIGSSPFYGTAGPPSAGAGAAASMIADREYMLRRMNAREYR